MSCRKASEEVGLECFGAQGFVTVVDNFRSFLDGLGPASTKGVKEGRFAEVEKLRSALCCLLDSLAALGLPEICNLLKERASVIVGDTVSFDFGIDVYAVLRLLHDSFLARVYSSRADADDACVRINDDLSRWPNAGVGNLALRQVRVSGLADGRWVVHRLTHNPRSVPLVPKRVRWDRKAEQWGSVTEGRIHEQNRRVGLQVDGREFPTSAEAPVGEDRCRGYGVAETNGWKDTGSKEYQKELEDHLRGCRDTQYSGIPDWAFELLVDHVRRNSRAYWIKGAKPTRLKNYVVEWDLDPQVPPIQAQPRRKSPALQEIEQRHLKREEEYGNLEEVPPTESVEWASPVDLVPKPGEDPPLGAGGEGRLVCDYRYVNTAIRAKAGAMTNMWDMVREAAGAALKSILDAYSGFSHLLLSKTLKNLLTIATSRGLMRWTTLPFGPKNGPPEFQAAINEVFRDLIPGAVRVFVDDLCARSGVWREGLKALSDRELVREHVTLLDRVAEIAIRAGLLFKFPKAQFLKEVVELVGFEVGRGRIRITEKRCEGLVNAPRPRTIGEMLSYLGALGFVRNMLPPDYSAVAGVLRDMIKDADPNVKVTLAEMKKQPKQLRKPEQEALEASVFDAQVARTREGGKLGIHLFLFDLEHRILLLEMEDGCFALPRLPVSWGSFSLRRAMRAAVIHWVEESCPGCCFHVSLTSFGSKRMWHHGVRWTLTDVVGRLDCDLPFPVGLAWVDPLSVVNGDVQGPDLLQIRVARALGLQIGLRARDDQRRRLGDGLTDALVLGPGDRGKLQCWADRGLNWQMISLPRPDSVHSLYWTAREFSMVRRSGVVWGVMDRPGQDAGLLRVLLQAMVRPFRVGVVWETPDRPSIVDWGHPIGKVVKAVQADAYLSEVQGRRWYSGTHPVINWLGDPRVSRGLSLQHGDPSAWLLETVLSGQPVNDARLNPGRTALVPALEGGDHVKVSQLKAKDRTALIWTPEKVEAFEESKRLLLRAVALELPDWDGAANGTNPFILMADRSKRAVGAALFQLPARDPKKGANAIRGSLRLLGVWSKSLSDQQSRWTVWEGELFAIREALQFFRDIVQGAHIVIGTDHLNNVLTTTTGELRQPQKILRWLLEIIGMGKIKWAFTPGAANVFADWASRNPAERDLIIPVEELELDPTVPHTLRDAFLAASASQGVPLGVARRAGPAPTQVSGSGDLAACIRRFRVGETPTGELVDHAASFMRSLREEQQKGIVWPAVSPRFVLRPTREGDHAVAKKRVASVYVPGVRLTDEVFSRREVCTTNVQFDSVLVVDPPREEEGIRKWIHPMRSKSKDQATVMRNAVLDGMLHLLRSLRDADADLRGIVAYGEAVYPVMAALRRTLREEAYTKRRCSAEERAALDSMMYRWEYVVLIDPGGYPARVLKTQVDENVSEFEVLFCPRSKQLLIVSFSQSATAAESRELSRRARGDVVRLDSDVAVRQAWNPPVSLELDTELRWDRGVDIPEEENELDVPVRGGKGAVKLAASVGEVGAAATAGTSGPWTCLPCLDPVKYHRSHTYKPGCKRYRPTGSVEVATRPSVGQPSSSVKAELGSGANLAEKLDDIGSEGSSSSSGALAGKRVADPPTVLPSVVEGDTQDVLPVAATGRPLSAPPIKRRRRPVATSTLEDLFEPEERDPSDEEDGLTPFLRNPAALDDSEPEVEAIEQHGVDGTGPEADPTPVAWGAVGEFQVGEVVYPLSKFRRELKAAQRLDPYCREIIGELEAQGAISTKPAGAVRDTLADPARDRHRIKVRAAQFRLDRKDRLLLRVLEDGLAVPVIPKCTYRGSMLVRDLKGGTWVDLITQDAHHTATGGHQSAKDMYQALRGQVWWEGMRNDCRRCYLRCKQCLAHKVTARPAVRVRSVAGKRPFLRCQMDVYKVNPPGEGGVCALLSVICVYSRYIFLRPLKLIDAEAVGEALMDVILDMGVVPLVLQSDQGPEFMNDLLAELSSLLGSRQVFSSSFHPQSQGIVERAHRTITALLGILIESLSKGRPRRWPRFIRVLEARLRDKTFGNSGLTPRGVVYGWFNVTPLSSALGVVQELPTELAYDSWVKEMVTEHVKLCQELEEVMDQSELTRDAYADEVRKGPRISVGQLVFLRKGHVERSTTATSVKLLSKCDGPYLVMEMPTPQNAILGDPFTQQRIDACSGGRAVAVDRLVLYPVDLDELPREDSVLPASELAGLQRNDVVAVVGDEDMVYLAQVELNHPNQSALSVFPMESVGQSRVRDRQWRLLSEAQMVGYTEVVTRVDLEPTGVLSTASVEELLARGIAI